MHGEWTNHDIDEFTMTDEWLPVPRISAYWRRAVNMHLLKSMLNISSLYLLVYHPFIAHVKYYM
jgi:hypothetical protein